VKAALQIRDSLLKPLQPSKKLLIPEPRILRFENPVVLVGVHDEARCDAFGAQRVVVLEAFVVGDAVVEFAVDDERRGLEVFREGVR